MTISLRMACANSAPNVASEGAPPSIRLWRCSAGPTPSRRQSTPVRQTGRGSKARRRRCCRDGRGTKVSHFLRWWRPVGQLGGKNLEDQLTLFEEWCPGAELNHRHTDFQSVALPAELPGHTAERGYKGTPLRLSSGLAAKAAGWRRAGNPRKIDQATFEEPPRWRVNSRCPKAALPRSTSRRSRSPIWTG